MYVHVPRTCTCTVHTSIYITCSTQLNLSSIKTARGQPGYIRHISIHVHVCTCTCIIMMLIYALCPCDDAEGAGGSGAGGGGDGAAGARRRTASQHLSTVAAEQPTRPQDRKLHTVSRCRIFFHSMRIQTARSTSHFFPSQYITCKM